VIPQYHDKRDAWMIKSRLCYVEFMGWDGQKMMGLFVIGWR
jgi:hypothetical protein